MRRLVTAIFAFIAAVGVAYAGSSKDEIIRKDQAQAAALAASSTANLQQIMDGQLRPAAVLAPAGVCDTGTPDLIVHDDGVLENGYGYNALASEGYIVDRFTPSSYPATVTTVCTAFITNTGVTNVNGWIEVYADDGPSNTPGTLLGSKAVSFPATAVSLGDPATFADFDLSDLNLEITSGSAYIGVRVPGTDGLFLASDESTSTPLGDGQTHANTDPWGSISTTWPDYRSMMIRAAMPASGPGAPSVQKAFAPTQILAGETSTLTITLKNNSQPTAAVLDADLEDVLPAGLEIASPANASTTCSGTLIANDGEDTITLESGAEIPASDSCTITVDITAAADGTYVNTIPVGALSTQHGSSAGEANASLTVGFTFPEPYLPVTFPSGIEPITNVNFAGINNTTPASSTVALEDFTAISGNVVPNGTFHISVQGYTGGNFTTKVNAFIDWNQNGVFDAGEEYQLGDLVNSTGIDGKKVEMDITVPTSAVPGPTRMRVMKKFNAYALPNNSTGFGQAEDYTINVIASSEPMVSKAFAPTQVLAGVPSTLTITLMNTENASDATLSADFTDTFPANLVVASTPNASSDCDSATVTANAGDGFVTLASGASIPGSDSCTISVDVESAVDGLYDNIIAAGALETTMGDNLFAANATLKVGYTFPEPYCPINFSTLEPISHVSFDGIDNASNPNATSPALEDFTAIVGNVMAGSTVHMEVQGNTSGNYTTVITAYIDWNGDGDFDDPGEAIVVGNIVNSTGADGKKAEADITIPLDATVGSTRMRITKNFSSGTSSACGNFSFGQAEDYTLVIAPPLPSVSKAFSPDTVDENEDSTLTITVSNPTSADATLTAPLVDTLPAGMTVSAVSTSCGLIFGRDSDTGILAGSITLPAGIVLPANSSCEVIATVQAALGGTYVNTIPAGALQTDQGDSVFDAVATLTVISPPPVIDVDPASISSSQDADQTTTHTLTINNLGGSDLTWSIDETPAFNQDPPSFRNINPISAGSVTLTSDAASGGAARGAFMPLAPTDISQMADNSPGDAGLACNAQDGSYISDNSWWRRFYFDEHPQVGATANITTVTISTGSIDFPGGVPSTINLYTIPHSAPVNTIPLGSLTLIGTANFVATGSLQSISVPVTGLVDDTAGKDLVVEWHTDGATGDVFYPGANETPETHPTFISSTGCGIAAPQTAASIGYPEFHLTMIVTVDNSGASASCSNPSDVPWLSVDTTTGTTPRSASDSVTVSLDSTGMNAGTYEANLCVASNDPDTPMVEVPVSLEVNTSTALPVIEVAPADLSATLFEDETSTDTLTIANIGGSDLNWSIADSSAGSTCADLSALGWLAADQAAGTTATGDSDTVTLTFDATGATPGTYQADLCISSNDPVNDLIVIPVSLTVEAIPGPSIEVDPGSLSSTQPAGVLTLHDLTIANTGGQDLIWTITEEPARPQPAAPGDTLARGNNGETGPAPQSNPAPQGFAVDEGFDDITALSGWLMGNHSSPLGSTDWFQGNTDVFPSYDGSPTAYIGANFNNAGAGGNIDNWLVTPLINFNAGDMLSFYTRTADGSIWADRLEVRLCTGGGCTDFGSSYGQTGDFTAVLLTVNESLDGSGYPQSWTEFTAALPASGQGRIAFRYHVPDNDNNSNFIGIDRVRIGSEGPAACSNPDTVDWVAAVAPANGTTGPGLSDTISVGLDSTGMTPGTYSANLCIDSNDADNPLVVVPVTMDVIQLPDDIFQDDFEGDPAFFSENFDSYGAGTQMHGTNGWKGWEQDSLAGALVTNLQSHSPDNSLAVEGFTDLVHEFNLTSGQWTISAWQYIPTGFSGESYFIALNTYDESVGAYNWSLQIKFDSATGTVTNDGGFNGGTAALVTGQWVELRLELDLDADTGAFFYNGTQLYSGIWSEQLEDSDNPTPPQAAFGALDLFANEASEIYYDDIKIVKVSP